MFVVGSSIIFAGLLLVAICLYTLIGWLGIVALVALVIGVVLLSAGIAVMLAAEDEALRRGGIKRLGDFEQ